MYAEQVGQTRMNPFSCREASEHTARQGTVELSGMGRWAYRFHLTYCWFCRKYNRQLRWMGEALRRCSDKQIASAHTDTLKKKILDRLQS